MSIVRLEIVAQRSIGGWVLHEPAATPRLFLNACAAISEAIRRAHEIDGHVQIYLEEAEGPCRIFDSRDPSVTLPPRQR